MSVVVTVLRGINRSVTAPPKPIAQQRSGPAHRRVRDARTRRTAEAPSATAATRTRGSCPDLAFLRACRGYQHPEFEGGPRQCDGRTEHTDHADPGAASRASRSSRQRKPPTMTTSHPLFGPCVPSVSLPTLVHVMNTAPAPRQQQRRTRDAPLLAAECQRAAACSFPWAMRDDARRGCSETWTPGPRGRRTRSCGHVRPRVQAGISGSRRSRAQATSA